MGGYTKLIQKSKKIAIISGARSDFGLIEIIIENIIESKILDLQLYITGMHLLKKFGLTKDIFEKKNYPNRIYVPMYSETSISLEKMNFGLSLGEGVKNFSLYFSKLNPDIILVSGDRLEMLAACVAAATLGIAIAHVHGGDVSENAQIDEQIRHAITKFAHIHFTASELSKRRILQMGEEKWRVINSGSPELDLIMKSKLLSKKALLENLGLSSKITSIENFVLCVQHPSIYFAKNSGQFMKIILKSLKKINSHTIIIYPNNDPGSDLIINEILKNELHPKFHIFKNLPRKIYLSVMKHALFMIGNSSSGIIESGIFKLPVLNVGIRNLNRECSENVLTVSSDEKMIMEGIQQIMSKKFREKLLLVKKNVYGSGNASEIIVRFLEKLEFNETLYRKKFIMI